MKRNLILFLFAVAFNACQTDVEMPEEVEMKLASLPDVLDYNAHIKPILSDRCFKCHGPDKNKIEAGLQLANFEGATIKLESGHHAVVPGNAHKSELVRRILSTDPEEMMPPPESHLSLSADEKAMLIKWIEDGSKFKEHWSLASIEKPDVPAVGKNFISKWGIRDDEETEWVANEIDHFVLAKLKEKGINRSGKAEKGVLLRRIYMDLTGLPPTPEEADQYLRDESDSAYIKVVDELLASKHFGEQQAVSWLDLARYADTHGYQDDGLRNVSPYRDWVIDAFNRNLPLGQFVTWQIAGDLMPNPTREMLIATSFNRQHPQSQEGGIVPEEYLNEYVADRTNTFGKAFLGLTMECARCHDHKYDPISTKDYYSLYAFFNQNKEFGEVPYNGEAAPTIMLPEKEAAEKVRFIREEIKKEETKFDRRLNSVKSAFEKYKATANQVDDQILKKDLLVHLTFDDAGKDGLLNSASSDIDAELSGDADRKPLSVEGKFGKGIQLQGDCGLQFISKTDRDAKRTEERFNKGLNLERNQPFSVSFWVRILKHGVEGPLITRNNGEFEGFRGYDIGLNADGTLTARMMHVYPSNGIEYRTKAKLQPNTWYHVAMTYDGSSKASGLTVFMNGEPGKVRLLTDNLTKSILHGAHKSNWSFMPMEIGKNFRSTITDVQFDEFRFYKRKLGQLEISSLYKNATGVALSGEKDKLFEFYLLNYDTSFANHQRELFDLRSTETVLVTDIPELMIMQELPADQKRKTYILERGVYDAPREEVTMETPLKFGKLPAEYPRNRLGLAKWLLDERNPLFARVMVNRLWMQFFGSGLVKTQEDFGNQGEFPSHPELLDWLAVTFREDGWDTKKLIRRIVLSSTYQQSSIASAEVREKDPDNKWLGRGPSYRYSAEQARDNALAASGLLVRRIGGPSVYPYQPAGIWEALATRNAVTYEQHHGDSLYRRSMYTIWKRSSPPPMMLNFDAPDRQACTVRRQRTSTPLQALITLNDPQFVEAARVMAEHAMRVKATTDERIRYIFLSAISRYPRTPELMAMKDLLTIQMDHFKNNPGAATKLRKVGEYPVDPELSATEVAAYTVVSNTVLNHDEALIKR